MRSFTFFVLLMLFTWPGASVGDAGLSNESLPNLNLSNVSMSNLSRSNECPPNLSISNECQSNLSQTSSLQPNPNLSNVSLSDQSLPSASPSDQKIQAAILSPQYRDSSFLSAQENTTASAPGNESTIDSGYPRTIIDSAGREVTVTMPIERIIVLCPQAAEAVTLLGADDRIIGIVDSIRSKGSLFLRLKDRTGVGKWDDPNADLIGAIAREENGSIKPDILILGYDYPDKPYGAAAVERKLSAYENITIAGFHYSQEIMREELRKLGRLLGKEKEAEDYLSWYSMRKSGIVDAVKSETDPKVYIELSSKGGIDSLESPGENNPLNPIFRDAGADSITRALPKSTSRVKWSWVVSRNPDIIIVVRSGDFTGWSRPPSLDTVEMEGLMSEISDRPDARSVSAVENRRIYFISGDILQGIKNVIGLTQLAGIFHPGLMNDTNEVYEQYFQRLNATSPEDHVLVYPEPG